MNRYPISSPTGSDCPTDHPFRLPQLLMEVWYDNSVYSGQWSQSANIAWPFLWSNVRFFGVNVISLVNGY